MSERPEMSEAIVAELVHRMRGLMAQTASAAPRTSLTMPVAPPEPTA